MSPSPSPLPPMCRLPDFDAIVATPLSFMVVEDDEEGEEKEDFTMMLPEIIDLEVETTPVTMTQTTVVVVVAAATNSTATSLLLLKGEEEETVNESSSSSSSEDGRSELDAVVVFNESSSPPSLFSLVLFQQRSRLAISASDGDTFHQQQQKQELARHQDASHLFRCARNLRHNQYHASPYGIVGLYQHLVEIRRDLQWAEDAVYRRQHGLPYVAWTDFQKLLLHHRNDHQHSHHYYDLYSCLTTLPPRLTLLLMFLSTVILLVSFAMNQWHVAPLSVNPMLGPSTQTLLSMGALERSRIVEQDQWYRILTAIPLHAGIFHWIVNLLALWFLGSAVERVHGTWRAAVVFLVAGVGGNLSSALFMPFSISMGASGGIYGWIGFCLSDVMRHWKLLTMKDDEFRFPYCSALVWLFLDLFLLVVVGLTPYIDNFSHMGGFFYGIGVGLPLLRPLKSPGFFGGTKHDPTVVSRCRWWSLVLVVGSLIVHVLLLAQSDSTYDVCKKCRFFSCVPFPFWTDNKWWYCDACDFCPANTTTRSGSVWLDIRCPYGDVLTLPLPLDMDDDTIFKSFVSQSCRQYCSL